MFKNLTPRSVAALAVVAASFFLMVCVARYGGAEFANAHAAPSAGFAARLSGWLVQNVGAGIWVLLLLPMAWGVVVYFDERTPELLMRLVGTLLLAVSVSTIAGLFHAGLWAGHVGNAVAGALGGVGPVLAWLVALPLFFVSAIFATDWMFHSLRRAGRAASEEPRPIPEEPAAAELLENPAQAEPREFVMETPRAAVAAAEMDDIVGETSIEATIPQGWDETDDDGRTVISSPGGYRGVEFLPQSDELALPEAPAPRPQYVPSAAAVAAAADALFDDEEFVTTPDAAFFVESPQDESEADTQEIAMSEQEAVPAAEPEEVEEAVQALFEAVTTPSEAAPVLATAPASGIGLPEDSPFADEFFPSDAGWPYAPEPTAAASDGASAASEMASTYSPATSAVPEPVPAQAAPADAAPPEPNEAFAVDEIYVSRLPAETFDDSLPAMEPASAAEAAPLSDAVVLEEPPAEIAPPAVVTVSAPEPQLSLFTEPAVAESPAAATAVATLPELDLSRLHSMELDPLFHDAVNAVLERGRASAVVLQRQLGIGYARGIRILDQMTAAGLTGPDTPTGSREIRVAREAWTAFTS